MKCRHCNHDLHLPLANLGIAPPSNAYVIEARLREPECCYPLRVLVCENCWLVQTEDFARAEELFDANYAYFSSYSSSWLAHAENYVEQMVNRFDLNGSSHVVEVAANDGYLLQYFLARGISCTGIEPTASTATAAMAKGIPIVEDFFGVRLADTLVADHLQADLIPANNVLAHVPDINDFVSGFARLLKPHGVATFEFPHLLRLIEGIQFDTIYHEHYSYLSLIAVEKIFTANGLSVFDVEELPTHGGSLRVFAQRTDYGMRQRNSAVDLLQEREREAMLHTADGYTGFQSQIEQVKHEFLNFLLNAKRQGQRIAAYGAAAKGNTLLNYVGVGTDFISYVVDQNPHKQGKYMPGSRIPIVSEARLREDMPDVIVILPWNLKTEVMETLKPAREWGAQFVTAIPELKVFCEQNLWLDPAAASPKSRLLFDYAVPAASRRPLERALACIPNGRIAMPLPGLG
jgi:SAM-dependent methyltransferase